MSELTINPTVTMSSLELVEFINSNRKEGEATLQHSDFLKKVLVVIGETVAGKFSSYYVASNGKSNPCYRFPKREACLMAMSYSYELQAKVFDRMTELEEQGKARPKTQIELLRENAKLSLDFAECLEREDKLKLEVEKKEQVIAIQTPKVNAYDKCINAEGTHEFRAICKNIFTTEKDLRVKCSTAIDGFGWIFRNDEGTWVATSKGLSGGYVVTKAKSYTKAGIEHSYLQVRLTSKGRDYIYSHIEEFKKVKVRGLR